MRDQNLEKNLSIEYNVDLYIDEYENRKNSIQTSLDTVVLNSYKNGTFIISNNLKSFDLINTYAFFNGSYSKELSPEITDQIYKGLKRKAIYCADWNELGQTMDEKLSLIEIHIGVEEEFSVPIEEIIHMVRTRLKLSGLPEVNIIVGVTKDTTQEKIELLRGHMVFGIVPSSRDWGAERTIKAINLAIDKFPYWPEDIISSLPVTSKLTNIIYFNDDHTNTPECTKEHALKLQATYTCPSNWAELTRELAQGHNHLVFHVDMIDRMNTSIEEFLDTLKNINRFNSDSRLCINAIIRKTTDYRIIKKLKKLGIDGIALDFRDWSLEEVNEGVEFFLRNESWWPKHIIDKLSGHEKITKVTNQIQLTERQKEVADLISQRGASNKSIGRLLNISESTVKIHVSAILKAFGVRNRTQLALALDGKF